jgi:DNA-directed RNA polymerase specialized sigma24 family protein
LVRRFRLPEADLDDLRQDLLVELLKRLHHFDPNRGTLGAFAATIIKHCASSFALRLRRDRTQIDPRSLDEPDKRPDGTTLGQILSEDRGYLAWISQAEDHVTRLERDLTLRRGVKALAPEQLQLLEQLSDHSVQSLSGNGVRSRATSAADPASASASARRATRASSACSHSGVSGRTTTNTESSSDPVRAAVRTHYSACWQGSSAGDEVAPRYSAVGASRVAPLPRHPQPQGYVQELH